MHSRSKAAKIAWSLWGLSMLLISLNCADFGKGVQRDNSSTDIYSARIDDLKKAKMRVDLYCGPNKPEAAAAQAAIDDLQNKSHKVDSADAELFAAEHPNNGSVVHGDRDPAAVDTAKLKFDDAKASAEVALA